MKTASNRKTRLDAIMIGRCQGDDTFVAFQPKGIFRFWNGKSPFLPKMSRENHFFSRDVYSPSIFLGPHSLLFQVSHYSLGSSSLAFLSARSMMEWKYEKIEGCEQSTISQLESQKGSLLTEKISKKSLELAVNPLPLVTLIAVETGKDKMKLVGMNCCITLLVISELKVNLHL